MRRTRSLRRQLITWLSVLLIVLWSISIPINFDIARQFVNLAYDRALLEIALDMGRNIKHVNNQSYLDLPESVVQMLQSRQSGRLHYLVTGPQGEYISGEPSLPTWNDSSLDRIQYYDDVYLGQDIRVVSLRVAVQPGSGKGADIIRVAEPMTLRTESAGQLLLRMVLPQAALIFLAIFSVWYAVGRGLAPLTALQREVEQRSDRDLATLTESVDRMVQSSGNHCVEDGIEQLIILGAGYVDRVNGSAGSPAADPRHE